MHLGMPVVALATTESVRAVAAGTGVVSTDVDELRLAVRAFLHEPDWAREVGARGREHALAHYGLATFLARWDDILTETVAAWPLSRTATHTYANAGGKTTTTTVAHAR
jgi:glycosyltransferase involved in cell wall biosynthesis